MPRLRRGSVGGHASRRGAAACGVLRARRSLRLAGVAARGADDLHRRARDGADLPRRSPRRAGPAAAASRTRFTTLVPWLTAPGLVDRGHRDRVRDDQVPADARHGGGDLPRVPPRPHRRLASRGRCSQPWPRSPRLRSPTRRSSSRSRSRIRLRRWRSGCSCGWRPYRPGARSRSPSVACVLATLIRSQLIALFAVLLVPSARARLAQRADAPLPVDVVALGLGRCRRPRRRRRAVRDGRDRPPLGGLGRDDGALEGPHRRVRPLGGGRVRDRRRRPAADRGAGGARATAGGAARPGDPRVRARVGLGAVLPRLLRRAQGRLHLDEARELRRRAEPDLPRADRLRLDRAPARASQPALVGGRWCDGVRPLPRRSTCRCGSISIRTTRRTGSPCSRSRTGCSRGPSRPSRAA